MKPFLIAATLALTLCTSSPLQADLGHRPGDPPPRRSSQPAPPSTDPEPTPMDNQWKWLLALFVVGMIGFTGWRFWSEAKKVRPAAKRKPWEFE